MTGPRDTGDMSWVPRSVAFGSRRTRGGEQLTEQHRERLTELAVIAERNRIAREMHDIVAHNLSVMVALTDGAALTIDRDPARAREAIRQAAATGRAALAEMRDTLALLRSGPEVTDLNLNLNLNPVSRTWTRCWRPRAAPACWSLTTSARPGTPSPSTG